MIEVKMKIEFEISGILKGMQIRPTASSIMVTLAA
jgi:hypothetical protein